MFEIIRNLFRKQSNETSMTAAATKKHFIDTSAATFADSFDVKELHIVATETFNQVFAVNTEKLTLQLHDSYKAFADSLHLRDNGMLLESDSSSLKIGLNQGALGMDNFKLLSESFENQIHSFLTNWQEFTNSFRELVVLHPLYQVQHHYQYETLYSFLVKSHIDNITQGKKLSEARRQSFIAKQELGEIDAKISELLNSEDGFDEACKLIEVKKEIMEKMKAGAKENLSEEAYEEASGDIDNHIEGLQQQSEAIQRRKEASKKNRFEDLEGLDVNKERDYSELDIKDELGIEPERSVDPEALKLIAADNDDLKFLLD